MNNLTLGALVHDFFLDYLAPAEGLRQSSVRSYRDTLRLFLPFVANDARQRISHLQLEDLRLERVLAFLRHMEQERHNSVSTRNQRLAALRPSSSTSVGEAPRSCICARRSRPYLPSARRYLPRISLHGSRCRLSSIDCQTAAGSHCATGRCCCFSITPAPACRRSRICAPST